MLNRTRLQDLLARMAKLRVAVVGDYCLDAYWRADMTLSEISRETPHHPLPVVGETYSPGAAGNVALNAAALGVAGVVAFTVLGEDWRAELLRQLLSGGGIDLTSALTAQQWSTPAYIKPIRCGYTSAQEDARLDFGNYGPLPEPSEACFVDILQRQLQGCHVALICDQFEYGVITPRLRETLEALARDRSPAVCMVDSRSRIAAFSGLMATPNELELLRSLGRASSEAESIADIAAAGVDLARRNGKPIFVTLGERGVLVCEGHQWSHVPAVQLGPPLDIVGAGDSFMAAAGCCLAAGATPAEAALVGNLASAVTVQKIQQTGTASPDELMASLALWLGQNTPSASREP